TPCSAPISPALFAASAASAALAAFSALSPRSTTTALRAGFTCFIRARCAVVTSSDVTPPALMAAAVSTADHCHIGAFVTFLLLATGAVRISAHERLRRYRIGGAYWMPPSFHK